MSKEMIGVILAGGKSRRMGTDKAFLEIGGMPLIERIVQTLLPLFPTVAVVSKEPKKFETVKERFEKILLIQDLFPEQHALGGVYTALSHFSGKDCFVFACDLPFLNPHLIWAMIQKQNGYEVLIPNSRQGLEPLHALYASGCLKTMEEQIQKKEWSLEGFVQKVRYGILTPDILHTFDQEELCFLNVNTPEEWHRAQEEALESERGQVGCA